MEHNIKLKVLLLENIHPEARLYFKARGLVVESLEYALSKKELLRKIKEVDVLGIRAKTVVDQDIINAGDKLKVIGCYMVGLNGIDIKACTKAEIKVVNVPYSSGRSVAEFVMASVLSLLRRIPQRSYEMHQGIWNKNFRGCYEARGKILGIIGYGNIGSQVSILAEALGMKVVFHDATTRCSLGSAKKADTIEELLSISDLVTLHVAEDKSTINLINKDKLARMKQGSYLINLSRGKVVNVPALAQALKKGHLAGAAIDVFPEEPASNKEEFISELKGLPNVILSPHVGASTEEAQKDIALVASEEIMRCLED